MELAVKHLHGNWPGKLPVVHRWPYDYSKPGAPADFIPQYISDEDIARGVRWWEEDFDPLTVIDRAEPEEGEKQAASPEPKPAPAFSPNAKPEEGSSPS